ncbi:hypothetical protein BT96DRAFT_1000459 [Gymnopus androsaceus JB14]|uniref:Tc1-like transposase DDE domain-containing protein n=1 Tax=Gymnopus androsaceus JB14 TaxID=1447944 RepID=A0A6A4H4I4_9AGAR|nr:hypothetical protein BT96DRAFT_1000459 [Gymnopus androsaceus JB14]
MGNRKISQDMKYTALRMWESGWDLDDICSVLVVSPSSMYRWRAILEEFGDVNRPPSGLQTYLDELQWFLAVEHDIAISIPSLQSNLEKAGLTRKLLHKIAIERDYQRQRDFCNGIRNLDHFSGTAHEFVTVDESSKNDHTTARRYGRAPIGQRADFEDVFVRGQRYTLCAAMSLKGYIATRVVEGSFDTSEYVSFLLDDVAPQMKPYPDEQSGYTST